MAWSQAYLTNVGKQLQASVMANELKLYIEEIWLGMAMLAMWKQPTT